MHQPRAKLYSYRFSLVQICSSAPIKMTRLPRIESAQPLGNGAQGGGLSTSASAPDLIRKPARNPNATHRVFAKEATFRSGKEVWGGAARSATKNVNALSALTAGWDQQKGRSGSLPRLPGLQLTMMQPPPPPREDEMDSEEEEEVEPPETVLPAAAAERLYCFGVGGDIAGLKKECASIGERFEAAVERVLPGFIDELTARAEEERRAAAESAPPPPEPPKGKKGAPAAPAAPEVDADEEARMMEEATSKAREECSWMVHDCHGQAPLLGLVVRRQNLDAATIMLDAGASVDAADDEGRRALHYVSAGSLEARLGLEPSTPSYAAVDAADADDAPPPSPAVACIELLLSRGAGVDARARDGSTALHHACRAGNAGCTRALLAGGGRVNTRDAMHSTVLMAAAAGGSADVVEMILAHIRAAAHAMYLERFEAEAEEAAAAGEPPPGSVPAEEVPEGEEPPVPPTSEERAVGAAERTVRSHLLKSDDLGWQPYHHAMANGHKALAEKLSTGQPTTRGRRPPSLLVSRSGK